MDEFSPHLDWLSTVSRRILAAVKSPDDVPLLCFSFADVRSELLLFPHLNTNPTIQDASRGLEYAVVMSIFNSNILNNLENKEILFSMVLKTLFETGFTPKFPCTTELLTKGSIEAHVNLCRAIEFLIIDRSLDIERLLEDLRHTPRSFFVLTNYPRPTLLEEAVSLWLNKFPCSYDLPQITNLQNDIQKGTHAAAVLSRIYPSQINKIDIVYSPQTKQYEHNWDIAKTILTDLNAYIPKSFPITDELILLAVADLYYATRSGVRKFVRVVAPTPIAVAKVRESRPQSAKLPQIVESIPKKSMKKVIKKTESVKTPNSVQASKQIRKSITKPVNKVLIKPIKAVDAHPKCVNETVNEIGLFELYQYISNGSRKSNFVEVGNVNNLIDPLNYLLNSPEKDQTFGKLNQLLNEFFDRELYFYNALSFLTALSSNNNEYSASRRIVYFARQMMSTYQNQITEPRITSSSQKQRRPNRNNFVYFSSIGIQETAENKELDREAKMTRRRAHAAPPTAQSVAVQTEEPVLNKKVSFKPEPPKSVAYPYGAIVTSNAPRYDRNWVYYANQNQRFTTKQRINQTPISARRKKLDDVSSSYRDQ